MATTKAPDPRPARTRAAIVAAATEVANRGGPWTVRAVTSAAGVSRSAFYLHFADLNEVGMALLVDSLRDEGVADLEDRALGADPRASAHAHLTAMLSQLRERQPIYGELLASNPALVSQVIIDTCTVQVETLARGHQVDSVAIRFISGGAALVVTDWLRQASPEVESAASLADRLLAVIPRWLLDPPHPTDPKPQPLHQSQEN